MVLAQPTAGGADSSAPRCAALSGTAAVRYIIDTNTHRDLKAKLALNMWSKS